MLSTIMHERYSDEMQKRNVRPLSLSFLFQSLTNIQIDLLKK
jgi:hypothetical protein